MIRGRLKSGWHLLPVRWDGFAVLAPGALDGYGGVRSGVLRAELVRRRRQAGLPEEIHVVGRELGVRGEELF